MKKLGSFFGLLFLFLIPTFVSASHNMGVDLTYECLNNCTIRVHLRGYRDCTGITTLSNSVTMTATTPGCPNLPTPLGGWSAQVVTEVTPICPGYPTRCTNPSASINGVQEYYWFRDYNICNASNCNFTLSWTDCCRNPGITSLTSPSSQGIWVGSTTLNTALNTCNSSPQFTNPPVPYVCQGQPYTFNQGATDPDGDSVSYSLGPCYTGNGTTVPYLAGYSAAAPMGPNWTVNINPTTGDITIAPNPSGPSPGNTQVAVMCVYVTEWRNGVAINTIVRDMQVTVIPCVANTAPSSTGLTNVTGGDQVNNLTVRVCAGNQICFDIPTTDPDVGQGMTVFWNGALSAQGGVFSNAANPGQLDTLTGQNITAHFCWTPMAAGTYTFLVTVRDSACPNYGQNQYTVTIQVVSLAANVTANVIGCGLAAFCVQPTQGYYPYTYTWTGPGGLTANPNAGDSCLNHVYGSPGTYAYTIQIQDSAGCGGVYSGNLVLTNTVNPDAGPDQTICSGTPITLGTPGSGNPDHVYSWTPAAGLSASNVPQPTVTPTNSTLFPQVQTFILTVTDTSVGGCFGSDTVNITVNPNPVASFNLSPQTCIGQPQVVTFSGVAAGGATYTWDFGPGASPATGSGVGPFNVSWSTSGTKNVTLQVVQFGCSSSVYLDSIRVNAIPTAVIAPVPNQCLTGNNFLFNSIGSYSSAATFSWSFQPGANSPTSTLENPSNIIFNSAGSHMATLQINDLGCISNVDTATFTLFPDPNPVFVSSSPSGCFGGNQFQFTATGNNGPGASFSWTFQDGNPATGSANQATVSFLTPGPKTVSLTVTQNGCDSTFTQVINVFPDPVADAGPNVSFCQGEGGTTLFASGVSGTTPYYYSWWCNQPICGLDSVNDDDPLANPTVNTLYYVQITDFNGCTSNVDSALVTVIPKPIVDAGPDIVICGDSAPCVILNPTVSNSPGPFAYQWFPPDGLNNSTIMNPCARPDTTTIYALVVTDLATGCTSDFTTTDTLSSIKVTVNPVPFANAGPDRDICFGDSAQLTGTGFGAGPVYDFEWSPSTGLSSTTSPVPFANPSITTEYVLTVWSNGCPSYGDSVTVNVHVNPTVNAGPDRDVCFGESTLLDAQASGDSTATYSFNWWPGAGLSSTSVEDPTATPTNTTLYYVQATTNYGCFSPIDSVLVTIKPSPIPDAGANVSICRGDSVQLLGTLSYPTADTVSNPNDLFYTWSPNGNISDPSVINPVVWPTASTWYYFTVDYSTCSHFDSVLVSVLNQIEISVSADTTSLCEGDSVQLNVTGGLGNAHFVWTPALGLDDAHSAQPMASPGQSITYSVLGQEGACSDTASISLTVIPTPEASYLSSLTQGCAPFEVNFLQNASDAILYTWNFGDGFVSNDPNPSHQFVEPGTYHVTMTAINFGGCSDQYEGAEIVVLAPPVAEFRSNPSFPATMYLPESTVDFTDLSRGATQWAWNFGDDQGSALQNPSHLYASEGEFYVTLRVTNEIGCMDEVQHGPYIIKTPELTVPNIVTPNGDGFNDVFLPKYTGSQPYSLKIVDRWGEPVFMSINKMEGWDGTRMGKNEAPDGVYYYTLTIGNKEFVGQVVLLR